MEELPGDATVCFVEQQGGQDAMSNRHQRSQEEYAQARRILGVALVSGLVTVGSALLLWLLWWVR